MRISKIISGVLAIILMAGIAQSSFARAKNNNKKTEFSIKLETEIDKNLQARIKNSAVSVVREDMADDEVAASGLVKATHTLQINKDAEVTGVKCQAVVKYIQYEGIDTENFRDKDLSGYLESLKSKMSERLLASLTSEVTNQETNFLSLRSKLGYKVSTKKTKPGQEYKHRLNISEFHICFADIHESSADGEKAELKFTVFVPTSVLESETAPIALNDFGFSHKQLKKEKAESDSDVNASGN